MSTQFISDAKVDENRYLKPFPSIKNTNPSQHFLPAAADWFNDHYGFRGYLIRLKDSLDYWVFHSSTKLYIGKDGWLFYKSVLDIDKPKANQYLAAHSSEVLSGIRELRRVLHARGVQLLILIPPMKEVIYPQYLPDNFDKGHKNASLIQLHNDLIKDESDIYINAIEILQNTAVQRPVFYKTDFHWNDPAAFEAAKNLVEKIDRIEGKRVPRWNHPLKTKIEYFSGGEALFMPIFPRPLSEEALMIEQTWALPKHSRKEGEPPFTFIYQEDNPGSQNLKPLVIFGDSFSGGLLSAGLASYFKKIYKIDNHTPLNAALENLPKDARYFLLEFVEGRTDIYEQLSKLGKVKTQ